MKFRKPFRALLLAFTLGALVACNLQGMPRPSTPPSTSPLPATTTELPTNPAETTLSPTPAPVGNADIIFTNGNILTMEDASPSAQAIAIQGDRILVVGTNDEVAQTRGAGTVVVDLGGRTIVPGFIDSHQYRIQRRAEVGISDAATIIQTAIQQGWTSLDELFVQQPLLDELQALDAAGTLRLRVNAYLPFMQYDETGTKLGDWYEVYHQGQVLSPHVRVAGLIGFADYDNARVLYWTQADLNSFLLRSQQEGWRVALKTVSTRSLETILRAYEYVRTLDPTIVQRRGQLEHALFITPDQIQRIKALGLIPIINLNNPGQLVGEADVDALIAQEPAGSYTPWRSLVEAGVPFANASGWPSYYVDEPSGAPFGSPIHLIYQAVTRVGNLGRRPPPELLDQAISAEDALRALTINGAYVTFEENSKGSLAPGKLADLVVLSDSPLTVPAEQINNIQVLMTMIGGKSEYCPPGSESLCLSAETTGIAPPTAASPEPVSDPFTGTWTGTDPDDGSQITLTLVQHGGQLSGSYADTYSANITPPGFQGSGTGQVLTASSAQMTFDLSRWDGKQISLPSTLELSDANQTLTMTYQGGGPAVLHRQ